MKLAGNRIYIAKKPTGLDTRAGSSSSKCKDPVLLLCVTPPQAVYLS